MTRYLVRYPDGTEHARWYLDFQEACDFASSIGGYVEEYTYELADVCLLADYRERAAR